MANSLGLLGPNGAGKTTLLSIITGIRRATAGSVRSAGSADTVRFPGSVRATIGLVPKRSRCTKP
ncbi:MAG: ATP-binding cassette domain-containing protein [Flavobacteriales bacterium]|nr:ATP-binding cassette domain-containing protein [Flavobacteriales bacterium]